MIFSVIIRRIKRKNHEKWTVFHKNHWNFGKKSSKSSWKNQFFFSDGPLSWPLSNLMKIVRQHENRETSWKLDRLVADTLLTKRSWWYQISIVAQVRRDWCSTSSPSSTSSTKFDEFDGLPKFDEIDADTRLLTLCAGRRVGDTGSGSTLALGLSYDQLRFKLDGTVICSWSFGDFVGWASRKPVKYHEKKMLITRWSVDFARFHENCRCKRRPSFFGDFSRILCAGHRENPRKFTKKWKSTE